MGRLAVVGDLVEDVVVWPERPLRRGTDTPARVFRARGGSAANVAVAAAAEVPVRFAGCVGDDPLGHRLVAALVEAGVEPHVQRRGRTGSVVVLVDVDVERTFLPDRGASAHLQPLDDAFLDGVDVLHVPAYGLHGGSTAGAVRALLAGARARGVAVSLDASSLAVLEAVGVEDVRRLVEQVRPVVLLANADEAALLQVRERPLPVEVVVKDGPRPTTVLGPDPLVVPVEPVDSVRDTTGAGDAFAAGWLTGWMEGLGPRERVERGHRRARDVLARPGA
ncbi:MAG TPA: PfkB family carbohydrate kinase [Mycobacteriales bacterium]|nr:PfkB family carbohydrate kinase [Mycobacteriales bacterium]